MGLLAFEGLVDRLFHLIDDNTDIGAVRGGHLTDLFGETPELAFSGPEASSEAPLSIYPKWQSTPWRRAGHRVISR